jgi:hypothetical protein
MFSLTCFSISSACETNKNLPNVHGFSIADAQSFPMILRDSDQDPDLDVEEYSEATVGELQS